VQEEQTTPATCWIGLDISKDTLDACLLRQTGKPQHKSLANTSAGHQKLLRWVQHLTAGQSCHFALEATGAYGQAVAEFLAQAEQRVSVLNPARVKYGGIATGQGNKTDKADAKTIADYCRLHAPPLWKQALPQVRLLTGLVRRLQSVKEARVQEKNRLQLPGHSEPVRRSIQESIAFLDRQAADLERQITEHIEGTPSLKADKELLTSIPGVGEIAAQQILAELPDV
jgi:transposase